MLSVLLMAPALVTPPRASSAVWRERMRAQRHIRPHVNPLQRRFRLPAALDLEGLAFAQPQAIHVDVGCGKGHFCADLAEARPDLNVLGIEIRDPLVEQYGQSAPLGSAPARHHCLLRLAMLAPGGTPHSGRATVLLSAQWEAATRGTSLGQSRRF